MDIFTSLPFLYFSLWNNFKLTKNLWDYYKELFAPKSLESNLPKCVQNDNIKLLNTTLFAKAKDWENTHVQHLQFQPTPQGAFSFSLFPYLELASLTGRKLALIMIASPYWRHPLSLGWHPRHCLCRSLAYPTWAQTPCAGPCPHVDTSSTQAPTWCWATAATSPFGLLFTLSSPCLTMHNFWINYSGRKEGVKGKEEEKGKIMRRTSLLFLH